MKINFMGFLAVAIVLFLFLVVGLEEYFRVQGRATLPVDALTLPPVSQGPYRGKGRLPSDPGRAAYFGRCSVALQVLAGTLPDQQSTLRLGPARLQQRDLLKASVVIGTLSRMLEVNEQRPAFDRNSEIRIFARQFPGQDQRLVEFTTNCMQASYKYANRFARVQTELSSKTK